MKPPPPGLLRIIKLQGLAAATVTFTTTFILYRYGYLQIMLDVCLLCLSLTARYQLPGRRESAGSNKMWSSTFKGRKPIIIYLLQKREYARGVINNGLKKMIPKSNFGYVVVIMHLNLTEKPIYVRHAPSCQLEVFQMILIDWCF